MKKIRVVSTVLLVVAVAIFYLGIILSAISSEVADIAFFAVLQASLVLFLCAGVGAFLIFAKNDTARKIGNGLSVFAFTVGAALSFYTLSFSDATGVSFGAICLLVAAVLLLLHYAFLFINYLLTRNNPELENPNDDLRVVRIREWKQLMEEEIITKEEYEQKRISILGLTKDEE